MSICCCLAAQSCSNLCDAMDCTTPCFLSFTISQSLLKLMSIKSVMLSNHLFFCHPIFFLSSIFPSIRVFSNESVLHIRWSKYWSFSFSISLSNENSRFISFRIDWLDPLAVQETPKSLLQQVQKYQFFGFDILSISLTESPQLCQLLTRESACSLKL